MATSLARRARGPFHLALAAMLVCGAQVARAQVVALEDQPPPVTAKDVSVALNELIEKPVAAGDPVSIANPKIDPGALDILLEPLTQAELRREMLAWKAMLRASVVDLSAANLRLFQLNAAQKRTADTSDGHGENAKPVQTPEQKALVTQITSLRETRTAISDRFLRVMDEFEAKGGDPAETKENRAYVSEVGGVQVDTQNAATAMATMRQWAVADDGGLRVLRHIGAVILATVGGALLGWLVSFLVNLWLRKSDFSSKLMRRFLRKWIGRVGGFIGFLVGLSWVGTNMTPILAGLGAAGFILAFALQNTISNFASGLLILVLRPFDVGDEIEAAGTAGKVRRVSLFSTYLATADGEQVIIPNNKVWEDVIKNASGPAASGEAGQPGSDRRA